MRFALFALALWVSVPLAAPAQAQAADTTATGDPVDLPPDTEPCDVEIFRAIYEVESPALVRPMRVVNATAYPIYAGTAPGLALAAALGAGDYEPAIRMATSQVVNFGITFSMKRLVRRPRPYRALIGVEARDWGHEGDEIFDPNSFPSGHTSTAAVLATSLSLSYPRWYVIAPAAAWVGTMGVARIWHGVHYPTDVAVGAAVGVASAVIVHLVWDAVDSESAGSGAVRVAIPL